MKRERTEYQRQWRANHPGYDAEYGRQYRQSRPGEHYLRTKAYIDSNPDKRRAHAKVGYEIEHGRLKRQPCEECAEPKTHAHHSDYTKPLEITWLCATCHRRKHANQTLEKQRRNGGMDRNS